MIGAVIGDIVGSVYEFNNYRAKDFDPLFHPKSFFTDDTICTIAVADALVNDRHPRESLRDWGRRYRDKVSWGSRFLRWIHSDSDKPIDSYGNGAAMRVSPAGFLATTLEEAVSLSNRVTQVTHNHPDGMAGAASTASAIFLARSGKTAEEIRAHVAETYGYKLHLTVDQIRPTYTFNETCIDTVPQALICALEATDFEDAIRNAVSIGGDSDTVAAIAGAVAEGLFGVPDHIAHQAWARIPLEMKIVLRKMYRPDSATVAETEGALHNHTTDRSHHG